MATRDPYLRIALETGFIDYLPRNDVATQIDLILELADGGEVKLLEAAVQGAVLLNRAHIEDGSRFVTARMAPANLDQLEAQGVFTEVELAEPIRHQRTLWPKDRPQDDLRQEEPPPEVKPASDTLAAIIDGGCPFAHAEFRRAQAPGTRVVTLWDMDPNPELAHEASGAPAGFFRGRDVPGRVLDAWMAARTSGQAVDEAGCYADAAYSAVEVELTHGSHLLGRLAGASYSRRSAGPDAAATADIAFVQLPRRVEEAPDAGSMHACILDALRYLRRFAERNGYRRCVVVCAKGSQLGPHDGTSLFERALDAFLQEPGTGFDIVFAAGNGFEDGVHAKLSPRAGEPASVAWLVPADNEVAAFAELWLDAPCDPVAISVQVQGQAEELPDGQVTCLAPWLTVLRAGPRVTLRAAPTRVSDGVTPAAPAGRVTIIAELANAPAGAAGPDVHAYLCWGGRNLGYTRQTRQAEWKIPQGAGRTVVDGHGTLIGDVCGASQAIHVMGGYVGANDPKGFRRAAYSAAGPARSKRQGPDCLGRTDTNAATPGIPGPGTRTGIVKRVWGTSVAAPQAARALINGEPLPAAGNDNVQEVGGGFLPP